MVKKHSDLPPTGTTTLEERNAGICRVGHPLFGGGLLTRKRYGKQSGYEYRCRECLNAYQRACHAKFPERYKLSPEADAARQRKNKYKISPVEYAEMVVRQKGCCAICQRDRKLAVDHNHKTGQVRGLLCLNCNTALGQVRESEETLRTMLDYLRKGGV